MDKKATNCEHTWRALDESNPLRERIYQRNSLSLVEMDWLWCVEEILQVPCWGGLDGCDYSLWLVGGRVEHHTLLEEKDLFLER